MGRAYVRHPGYLVQPLPDTSPDGLEGFHFVVKRSYRIEPDQTAVPVDLQRVLNLADVYADPENASRSALLHATDLTPPKALCDVVLLGHCHPPGGEATSCEVTLRFGELRKSVLVLGDRSAWLPGREGKARLNPARPFQAMPLGWERAYGGVAQFETGDVPHPANPAGVGFWLRSMNPDEPRDRYGPLPNLERADGVLNVDELLVDPAKLDGAPVPAGFGFVPPHWAPRMKRGGHDPRFRGIWERMTADLPPGQPGPRWFERDPRYFNQAPDDQQAPLPKGGERVAITHVHPDHQELRFRLPEHTPTLRWSLGGPYEEVPLQLDTVVIDADRLALDLVWRGTAKTLRGGHLMDLPPVKHEVDGQPTLPAALVDSGFPLRLLYPEVG